MPDELTSAIVRDRLQQGDAAGGFLLDGYPRNLGQVADLDAFLEDRGESLTAVIELSVPREESIARLSLRADRAGTRRRQRGVDRQAPRRSTSRETAPILDVYRERGIVDEIDGVGSLDEITELASPRRSPRAASRPDRGPSPLAVQDARRSCARWSSRASSRPPRSTPCVRWSHPASRRRSSMPRRPPSSRARGAESNFQLVRGYRHTTCISVNNEVVHGIPGDRALEPGDIVSIDAGAQYQGWNGDQRHHGRRCPIRHGPSSSRRDSDCRT